MVPTENHQDTNSPSGRSIIVRLSPATHKALRVHVALHDLSIQKFVERLIERELQISPSEEASRE